MATERVTLTAASPVAHLTDDPCVVVSAGVEPEWLLVPADIAGLGGRRVPVLGPCSARCTRCNGQARAFLLERLPVPDLAGKVLGIVECYVEREFIWFAASAARD